MATVETAALDANLSAPALWPALARRATLWLGAGGLAARDSVLLLPYAALLPLARRAFAAQGGWQPRIETPLTLAATLGPPPAPVPGGVGGDVVTDRLVAARLLLRQPWGQAWAQRDRRGFDVVVANVVDAAQALARAATEMPPAEREAYWTRAQHGLGASPSVPGPGAIENLLLALALQWAMMGSSAATDALFEVQPAAWMALRIGGPDHLAEAVLAAASCPALLLDADPALNEPFRDFIHNPVPRALVCDSLEAEAQAACAATIEALNAGQRPVALIALDRVLMRRVRALLGRQGVAIDDETGWRLSTTRAGASLMALLRAAESGGNADLRLDWLKGLPMSEAQARHLQVLEALWRGTRPIPDGAAAASAKAWWDTMSTTLAVLADAGQGEGRPQRTLAAWVELAGMTQRSAAAEPESAQVRRALRIDHPDAAWLEAAMTTRLDLAGFIAWVQAVLEQTNFEPAQPAAVDVVLTPLARAVGRPFGHIVMPGADQVHLGAYPARPALISDRVAARLGLRDSRRTQQRERAAFAQLLRAPALTLLRRCADAGEPLAPSPLVEWAMLARAGAGMPGGAEQPWSAARTRRPRREALRPVPTAAHALPATLSASTVEALRQCPYRFFARAVLRLEEPAELDAPLVKRDYGNWLHEVLHRFHRDRSSAGGDDLRQLHQAALLAAQGLRLDGAELLPYRASFESFAPAYLRWLHRRESLGWKWSGGEVELSASPQALEPQTMRGRVDRLDRGLLGEVQVIDYKTGNAQDLSKRVRTPLEDTQLAFYAVLAQPAGAPLSAMYLALDDPNAPVEIGHRAVVDTAVALLDGLAQDFSRLRQGAPMPALGEGRVCETCEARGLCRRDDWPRALEQST